MVLLVRVAFIAKLTSKKAEESRRKNIRIVMLNSFQHLFDEIPKQVRNDNMDEFVVLDATLRSA